MTNQTDKLGTAPLGKLFLTMSLPIILAMLVNGLYSIADAIFIARGVGSLAIGGVSIVFPVQMLIFAFAAIIGSGSASIVSRKLGAKQDDEARHTAQTALTFSIVFSVVLAGLVLYAMEPILRILGVTDALWEYSVDYLKPLLYATPVAIIGTVFSDMLRAEGKMQFMMMVMLLGSLLNITFDAIFIFGLDMGVTGAALATVIAQVGSLLLSFSFYLRKKTALHLSLKGWRIDTKVLAGIIALGLPFFISHAGASFMIATANNALSNVGGDAADIYISAYGLVGRVIMFVVLPLIGIMISFQTLAGYNYGAQNFDRVRSIVNIGIGSSTVLCVFVSTLMLLKPELLLGLFTDDPVLLAKAIEIAKKIFMLFSLAGVGFIITGYFQATGHARMALFASSARIYIFLIPLLILLPKQLGIDGIWYAFPIADGSAFILAVILFVRYYRRLLNHQSS